jgi:hypothetical protein
MGRTKEGLGGLGCYLSWLSRVPLCPAKMCGFPRKPHTFDAYPLDSVGALLIIKLPFIPPHPEAGVLVIISIAMLYGYMCL